MQVETPLQYLETSLRTLTWPAIIFACVWVVRFITKMESRVSEKEKKFDEIHLQMTNHMPHSLEKLVELAEKQDRRWDQWLLIKANTPKDE